MQRFFISGFILIASFLLMQCAGESNAETAAEKAERATPVKVMALQPTSFANYLQITGVVHARNHVEIMVEEAGTLKEIRIDKGRYANAGDTLAVLENQMLAAQFQQAEAGLRQAELAYKSRKVLYEKKAISENEYLSAKYDLNAAKAAYDLAKVRYRKLFITAPLGGLVNQRYYDRGAYCNPMSPIFEFIDNSYMKIRAGVAERFLGNINVGTPVQITFDAFPDLQIDAKVSFVSRSINSQNRTFEIEVSVPNTNRRLAPEMIANVKVLREAYENGLVVPLDALIESENGWHVFVAEGDRARKVTVQQRAIYQNAVLVDGVKSGDKLITVGQRSLSDGDLLDIQK